MSENRPVPGTTEYGQMRRRQTGCVVILSAALAMLLLVVGYVSLFHSVPLRISKETTYITEPLKSSGKEVDYFAAWERATYPENIATEENGYRLIAQHIGLPSDTQPEYRAQVYEKLGLNARAIRLDMPLEEPYDFLKRHVASQEFGETLIARFLDAGAAQETAPSAAENVPRLEPPFVLWDRLGKPWTLDDLPMMDAWLEENGPALDLIVQAARKPVFHIPRATRTEDAPIILLHDFQRMRAFARVLSARAHYRIATGDVDGAIDDVVACKRLGRRVGHQGLFVEMLVGIALEGIADDVGIAGSLDHPPAKAQLERLIAELANLPPEAKLETAMLIERYMVLDIVQAMARGRGTFQDLDLLGTWPMLSRLGYDWNIVAKRVNNHFDTMIPSVSPPNPPSLWTIVLPHLRSEMAGDWIAAVLFPPTDVVRESMRRRTCAERMQRIALAMLLYERDHGALPPACTLDADGKPLHSWRVALLPYLGKQELYEKIRLDQPWDSPHNRKFHEETVEFYQCPSAGLAPGETTYAVVAGPEMPFAPGQGKKLSDFGSKSAGMILVVETKEAAGWMDPTRDLSQSAAEQGINRADGTGAGIGSPHPGGANFGHRDGAARFNSESEGTERLKAMLRGTGG